MRLARFSSPCRLVKMLHVQQIGVPALQAAADIMCAAYRGSGRIDVGPCRGSIQGARALRARRRQ